MTSALEKTLMNHVMMIDTHARIKLPTNFGNMNYIIFNIKIKYGVVKIHRNVIWLLYQNLTPRNKKIPADYDIISSSYITIADAESFMLKRISKSSPTYTVIETFFKTDLTNQNVISITRKLLDDESKK